MKVHSHWAIFALRSRVMRPSARGLQQGGKRKRISTIREGARGGGDQWLTSAGGGERREGSKQWRPSTWYGRTVVMNGSRLSAEGWFVGIPTCSIINTVSAWDQQDDLVERKPALIWKVRLHFVRLKWRYWFQEGFVSVARRDATIEGRV